MTLILILLAIAMPLLGFTTKLAGRVVGLAIGLLIGLCMIGFTTMFGSLKAKSKTTGSRE